MPGRDGIPSVTEILEATGLAPDFSRIDPDVLERARKRGSIVHEAIEAHAYGLITSADEVDEIGRGHFQGYLKFLAETKHEPIVSEYEVVSKRWGFLGHLDRAGWLNGQRALIDSKNTDVVDPLYVGAQLAGYRMAWQEMRPKEPIAVLAALHLSGDGTYKLAPVSASKYEPIFQAAVILFHARQERANGNG